MSKRYYCLLGICAAVVLVDRSNAIDVVFWILCLLSAIGLHWATESLFDVLPGSKRPLSFFYRVAPALLLVSGMTICILLVHWRFVGDSHVAVEHASSESLKTLIAFATIRYFR